MRQSHKDSLTAASIKETILNSKINHFLVKSFFLLLFTVLFTPPLSAQVYTFFENRAITPASIRAYPQSQTRQILSLVGKWKVKLPGGLESEINVPSAFSFSGKVTFEKVMMLPKAFESRALMLVSEGMGTRCEIFFNDQFVGAQTVGGAPFKIDIPSEMLRFGAENTLKIICDSRLNVPNAFPLSPQAYDKQNFAGLFRNLYLVATSPIRFDDVDFRYHVSDTLIMPLQRTPAALPDTQVTVKLDLTVSVKQFDLRGYSLAVDSIGRKRVVAYGQLFLDTLKVSDKVQLAQFDAASNQVIRAPSSFQILNAKLWQPTSPTRYSLHLELLTSTGDTLDDLTFLLGFRTVGFASGNFQLNRKPFLLKGLHVSEETEQTANVLSPDDILRDLMLIRSAGVNAICLTELPNPIWYHFCDSLGLLLFIQLPVRNAPSRLLVQPSFLQQSELALQESISRSKFHPSVIGYGLGEGIDLADTPEAYLKGLSNLVRTNTQGLVYFTAKSLQPSPYWQYSDFIAFSDFNGSFDAFKNKFDFAKTLANTEKPILIAHYGALAETDNHNGYSDPRSLEHQAKFLLDRFRLLEEAYQQSQPVSGGFVYTFCDYHLAIAPVLGSDARDPYLATFGLLTLGREKKISFQMLKSLYLGERVYNPPIGSPKSDFSPSLILASIFLTALLVYLINGNRRLQENLQRALVRPINLYMDIRDQRLYSAFDPITLLLLLSLIWASILAAFLYSLRTNADLDFWLSHFIRAALLKESINYLALHPHFAILIFALVFLIFSLLLPLLSKFLIGLVKRTRVTYLQLLHVWTWASAPWIILVFAAAFIDRLENNAFNFVVLFLCILLFLIALSRFLRGIAVVAEVNRVVVWLTGFLLLVLSLSVLFYLSDTFYHTSAYLQYQYHGLKEGLKIISTQL